MNEIKAEFYIIDMHSDRVKARDGLDPCYSWRLVIPGGGTLVPLVGHKNRDDTIEHAVETLTVLGFDEIEEVSAP